MREVEIKLKVSDLGVLQNKLEHLGCVFGDKIEQEDIVFAKNLGSIEVFNANDEFLRIRTQSNGKIVFTYKKDHNPGVRGLDKLEYEFEIGDKEECQQFILALGYKRAVRNFKKRIKAKFEEFEICLDDVEDLGTFAEFEKGIPDEANPETTFKELEAFVESLGLNMNDRTKDGYDILLLKKNPN